MDLGDKDLQKKAEELQKMFHHIAMNTLNRKGEARPSYDDIFKTLVITKLSSLELSIEKIKKRKIDVIQDIRNWVNQELSQTKQSKMGKHSSPYREDKIEFLERILRKLELNLEV